MTLGNTGMTWPPLLPEQFTANRTVAQIGFCAVTEDRWCIAPPYTNVVQHRCFLDELPVNLQFGMAVANLQTAVCHLSRVLYEQLSQLRRLGLTIFFLWVILVNNRLIIHNGIYKEHIV